MLERIPGGVEMRIGLFADPHDSTKDVSCVTRRPSLSWGKIQRAMEAFVGVDLVVCLGDLTDDCVDPEDNAPRLRALSEMIRGYGISFVSLMGNHDCNVFTREEFDALGGNRPPFSLRFNNVLLIFLDANYARNGVPYKPGTVDWTDTAVPDWQLEQLRCALADEDIREAVVFVHQNLDPGVQWQHIIANHAEVREILERSGKVRRVIQGHYHPGHDGTINGIEYHTLPAMCEGEGNYFEIIEV